MYHKKCPIYLVYPISQYMPLDMDKIWYTPTTDIQQYPLFQGVNRSISDCTPVFHRIPSSKVKNICSITDHKLSVTREIFIPHHHHHQQQQQIYQYHIHPCFRPDTYPALSETLTWYEVVIQTTNYRVTHDVFIPHHHQQPMYPYLHPCFRPFPFLWIKSSYTFDPSFSVQWNYRSHMGRGSRTHTAVDECRNEMVDRLARSRFD